METVNETSAGGLVVDRSGPAPQGALIGKRDRSGRLVWSLPKGHVEPGESPPQAAVREVAEETGITGEVIADLGTIDYWFVASGRRIHKTVHHYLLEAVGGELSATDVEVEEVAWVPLSAVATRMGYEDERRLLDRLPSLLAETA
jgi:8-oxo-dGTP pyrophosphatase MutT (NUDIX family)